MELLSLPPWDSWVVEDRAPRGGYLSFAAHLRCHGGRSMDFGDRQPCVPILVPTLAICVAWAKTLHELEHQFSYLYNGQSYLPGLRDHTHRAWGHLVLITKDRGWLRGCGSLAGGHFSSRARGERAVRVRFPDRCLWMAGPCRKRGSARNISSTF